ncbi:MAG: phosphotransferase [Candidatus Magasanikbacteria bacterium]|nr:phosphotransferase [Candidatus Magasanikbacteria bacterium]
MTETIKQVIVEILTEAGITLISQEISIVKMRASISYKGGKVLFFVFKKHEPAPIAVAKFTELNSTLSAVQEADYLKTVESDLAGTLISASVPRIYGSKTLLSGQLSVESFVGNSAVQTIDDAYIAQAFKWLTQFHTIVKGKKTITITAQDYKNKLEEYEKLIPNLFPETSYRERVYLFIDTFFAKEAELISWSQHGDFHPGNVLVVNDRIAVIDWSRYGTLNVPGFDAIFFARRCPGGIEAQKKHLDLYFETFQISQGAQNFAYVIGDLFDSLERHAIGNAPYLSNFFPIFFERNRMFSI